LIWFAGEGGVIPRRWIVAAGIVLSRGRAIAGLEARTGMMKKQRFKSLMTWWFVAGACVAAAGCHSGQSESEKEKAKEDFREAWAHRAPPPEASHPKSVVVAQGPSPLVYQVQEPCTVHVVDTTTGAEIATAAARKLGMVYVSEETGAFVNGERVVPGPFNHGHRYSISVDMPHDETWGSYLKFKPPQVTSQPSGQ
jgi:hypothetical protein